MLKVLQTMEENLRIRQVMKDEGRSFVSETPARPRNLVSRLLWPDVPHVGDKVKSWDVYETARLIAQNFKPTDRVLDMGAYGSEVLLVLETMGFTNLVGIDLNPEVKRMPHGGHVQFAVGDFYSTGFSDQSFSAVTSISAIEHGCDVARLVKEVARILKPGGVFIASTDYWPTKIDTSGIRMFGLDWKIFSESEMRELFELGQAVGLEPMGPCDYTTESAPPIECEGRRYSFALLAMRKKG